MHINDEVLPLCSDKSTAILVSNSTETSILPNKSNIQMDIELTADTNNVDRVIGNTLVKCQCQKWQQFFDFDNILKQIRLAEKQHIRSKNESPLSKVGNIGMPPNIIFSSSKPATLPPIKCTRPLKQVQRLNGNDMHYYGIAPKQAALNVIVCNMCLGIYTKIGFNNHMILQHPSAWNAIASKVHSTSDHNEAYNLSVNENSEDIIHNVPVFAEISEPVKSSDMSGVNSSNTASSLSIYTVAHRHKFINNVPAAGSNCSGSSSVRLRNKHSRYKANKDMVESKSRNTENNQSSSKNSKKTSPLNVTISPGPTSGIIDSASSLNKSQSTAIYSSSSNSSCSLPPTPKMSITSVEIKSPIISQEFADSSTSSSSSEYGRGSSIGTSASTKLSKASNFIAIFKPNTTATTVKLSVHDRNVDCFESCELDQAVSSITECYETEKADVCNKDVNTSINSSPDSFYKQSSVINNAEKLNSVDGSSPIVQSGNAHTLASSEMSQTNDEVITANTCEDNSILTLDDVLDSKFINEILNTTESEIHFDENELEGGSQHQICQQHSTKRMRFDETVISSQQERISEVANSLTAYLHQQNQHTQFNAANFDLQQQQQHDQKLNAIHAMQIQELFYQQQNLHSYENSVDHTDTSTLQHRQQPDQNGTVNVKHIFDFRSTSNIHKPNPSTMRDKLSEVTSIPLINNVYESINCYDAMSLQFQVNNVPSLTDNNREDSEILIHNIANDIRRIPQQYVLPNSNDHIFFEISDANQLAYCQPRPQQMLIDFFNQTNYENVEQVNNEAIIPNGRFPTIPHPPSLMSTISKIECVDNFDSKNFDFSLTDSLKLFSSNAIKDGHKCFEDIYVNVFLYAGIPRPMSINCFGLIKLPFSTAATFRKHLLSARKANNSPITLSGGLNGIVGSNPRLSYSKSISSPNTNNSNSSINEFSIGSVTITSLTTSHNLSYTPQKHAMGGNLEMVLHNNLQNSNIISGTTLQRQKLKVNSPNICGNVSAPSFIRSKSQTNLVTSFAAATIGSRFPSRTNSNLHLQNYKTLHINNNSTIGNDKVKYIRSSVFIACKTNAAKNPKFCSRHIADFLGGLNKNKHIKYKRQPLSQEYWINRAQDGVGGERQELRADHIFFQHRRKLFDLTINCRKK